MVREKNLHKVYNPPGIVFLDRDGTINEGEGFFKEKERFVLLENAAEGIKKINSLGLLAVVTTNQPGVARGLMSEEDVVKINEYMVELLGREGAKLDGIYFCPHSRLADVPEYRKDCASRKPNTGMYERAAEKFGADLKNCFVIGDSVRDVLGGKRAGCVTIGVETGDRCKDKREDVTEPVEADYIAKDLLEAAEIIEKVVKERG